MVSREGEGRCSRGSGSNECPNLGKALAECGHGLGGMWRQLRQDPASLLRASVAEDQALGPLPGQPRVWAHGLVASVFASAQRGC